MCFTLKFSLSILQFSPITKILRVQTSVFAKSEEEIISCTTNLEGRCEEGNNTRQTKYEVMRKRERERERERDLSKRKRE